MTPQEINNEHLASTVLKNCKKRNFTGSYAPTAAEARAQLRSLLQPGMIVACGGSESIEEIGFRELANECSCTLIDRSAGKNAEEKRALHAKSILADLYLMSTNALTVDGELVNVDGSGNRISCLAYGPDKVVLIVGLNKVCRDLPTALQRLRVQAAPPNCVRLGLNTPCSVTGVCGDCHSPDCICCTTTVTRHSRTPGRIHLILVGETLGY